MMVRLPPLSVPSDRVVIRCGLPEAGTVIAPEGKLVWLPKNGQEDMINSCRGTLLLFFILNNRLVTIVSYGFASILEGYF